MRGDKVAGDARPTRSTGLLLEGAVTELFDVAVIPEVRCPRGVGPEAGEMAELVRGEVVLEKLASKL